MLVDTFGTGMVLRRQADRRPCSRSFDARPGLLIQELDLRRPIFRKTAACGHFGREEVEFLGRRRRASRSSGSARTPATASPPPTVTAPARSLEKKAAAGKKAAAPAPALRGPGHAKKGGMSSPSARA